MVGRIRTPTEALSIRLALNEHEAGAGTGVVIVATASAEQLTRSGLPMTGTPLAF